jgi:hypothetical protein
MNDSEADQFCELAAEIVMSFIEGLGYGLDSLAMLLREEFNRGPCVEVCFLFFRHVLFPSLPGVVRGYEGSMNNMFGIRQEKKRTKCSLFYFGISGKWQNQAQRRLGLLQPAPVNKG